MAICTLNNTRMRVFRASQEYQAVMIDLALNGIADRDKVEKLLGYKIPSYIRPIVRDEQSAVTSSKRSKTEE